ncbi:hypothetical protein GXW82_18840 [Streptacidiphilus sp. 4-A2]|nr:hypothetical protein [Streptacidiphilus sp. 4-A2]
MVGILCNDGGDGHPGTPWTPPQEPPNPDGSTPPETETTASNGRRSAAGEPHRR